MKPLLVKSEVRKLLNSRGRLLTKEAWHILNGFVTEKLEKACSIHNGGKMSLDAVVLAHVGVTFYRQPTNT